MNGVKSSVAIAGVISLAAVLAFVVWLIAAWNA